MSTAPAVSVLVLHYGNPEDTARCLRSLIGDGFGDKEILVLDNCSPARMPDAMLAEFSGRVRFFYSAENLGFAGGNNFLAARATGEFLALLNNDAVATPGWLPPLIAALADPAVGSCQPKIRSLLHPEKFDYAGACGGYLDSFGFTYARGRVFDAVEVDHGQYDDQCDIHWASGAAFLTRRQLFLDIGGFDAFLFAYVEEVDFSYRLRRAGYRILSIPSSVVLHEGGKALARNIPRKVFLLHRNNLLVLAKNLPLRRAIVVLPIRLALEWVASVYYLFHGQLRCALMPIRSFFQFFVLAPAYLKKRPRGEKSLTVPVASVVASYFFLGRRTWSDVQGSAAAR